jgi:1-acyl-sn-glycerol-3-phosphate acyltransferase
MQNKINIDQHKEKFIDIERVISKKNPNLLKIMPGFLMRYIKKILHVEELNNLLNEQKGVNGIDFVKASLRHFGVKIEIYGLENLNTNEKLAVVSNHPLGGLDGLCLMLSTSIVKPDIVFPANDILLSFPNLQNIFIPINKHGKNPKDAIVLLDKMFASDKTILLFPAGLVSRKQNGNITDFEWKKTFVSKSKKHKRKIIPVYINGENSNFFYNLANLRKFFGIKANLEMFYLVNEMYKQYNKVISIYFGEPIDINDFPKEMSENEIANHIKSIVYDLQRKCINSNNKEIWT